LKAKRMTTKAVAMPTMVLDSVTYFCPRLRGSTPQLAKLMFFVAAMWLGDELLQAMANVRTQCFGNRAAGSDTCGDLTLECRVGAYALSVCRCAGLGLESFQETCCLPQVSKRG
jgi:hypothetical protein